MGHVVFAYVGKSRLNPVDALKAVIENCIKLLDVAWEIRTEMFCRRVQMLPVGAYIVLVFTLDAPIGSTIKQMTPYTPGPFLRDLEKQVFGKLSFVMQVF